MAESLLVRAASLYARIVLPLIAVPLLVYALTWVWDPYAFGFAVLGLAPVQLAGALTGAAFTALGVHRWPRAGSLLASAALAGSGVGAFLALRSIHWA